MKRHAVRHLRLRLQQTENEMSREINAGELTVPRARRSRVKVVKEFGYGD